MCGIFGCVVIDKEAGIKTLRGLRDLEYRGYDSWGIAVKCGTSIHFKKQVGKISDVKEGFWRRTGGTMSVGHTRWATHGGVTKGNAHPHFNSDKTIAVVHNGIIENYLDLRDEISRAFRRDVFISETDTEVIPHLIGLYMRKGASLESAFLRTCKKLKGRFAFVVLSRGAEYLLAARNGSPLVVGKGNGEYFIASDIPAFLSYTNVLNYMEDGEWAKAAPNGVSFGNFKTEKIVRKRDERSAWGKEAATKNGQPHFMMKEIMEQGETLGEALFQDAARLREAARLIKNSPDVTFAACGTANHVAMLGEYLFSKIAKKNIRAIHASEFKKHAPFLTKESIVIPITQSGETADVLEAIKLAKSKKATIISIINARGSSVERESDYFFPINAGPEIAVASTKAATGQMLALFLIAHAIVGKHKKGKEILEKDAKKISAWLTKELSDEAKKIARYIVRENDLYTIGKGELYPIALEASLKIKEVSYIHAEGFAAAELKHGTIALVEKGTPIVAHVGDDETREDVLSNVEETKARGARIVGVASKNDERFDYNIPVPKLKLLAPVAHTIAAQMLAYHLAAIRGIDPDKPRNLAKSVTVK